MKDFVVTREAMKFRKGSMELALLGVLAEDDLYGYQILLKMKEPSFSALALPVGSVYSILRRMENQGYVTSKWEKGAGKRRRRRYSVTSEGRAALKSGAAVWKEIFIALRRVIPIPSA